MENGVYNFIKVCKFNKFELFFARFVTGFIEKDGIQCLLDFLKNMDYDTWYINTITSICYII